MQKHILPALHIRLKKHSDGSASITLTRADGSVTWQRQKGSLALVFPQHDLTHFAVETTLHCHGAFFGLVADGWGISDFAAPFARGSIPAEVREAEMLVGLFDGMRQSRSAVDSAQMNAELKRLVTDSKFSGISPRVLTSEQIERVRTLRAELLRRWYATQPGDAIELKFERVPTSAI